MSRAAATHGRSDGEVELAFTSADAPDAVAPGIAIRRAAPDFTVASSANREGAGFVIAGTTGRQ